ncbi:MAG: multidrug effflux MFS transporter [Roseovarius sp.]
MNTQTRPTLTLSKPEFIALVAMLVAAVAFSIDSMLPAMPQIAQELTPQDPNKAQLIITSFVLGMGLGTFFAGPLSDSYGRKPVIIWGAVLYITASALAWLAPSLELVLLARVLQGVAAAAARIVPMAMTRDYYAGRGMARIVSFIMMVFTLVPAVAPLAGSVIIDAFGWRAIFGVFILFAMVSTLWLTIRVPEPLPHPDRRPFRPHALWASASEVLSHRVVMRSTAIQALCMTALFSSLSTIHQVFDLTYGRAEGFPWYFCAIALIAGAFSLLNATLVVRLGMRRLVRYAMVMLIGLTLAMITVNIAFASAGLPFAAYFAWQLAVFIHTSMTLGNLNAIALEPMGHIAGMATSVFSALATVGAVILTVPIGLAFNGTPLPLMIGSLGAIILAFVLTQGLPQDSETDAPA